ncbi:MAG: nucleoside-diphosphate kinase [candidate division Zixibacteria bacterium]|nr:nucleoside-diphosphate kinase [candidate division Zixibacteria bacterium]
MQKTLLIIKPDAVERKLIGHILSRLEQAKFNILEMKMLHLSPERARRFYAVHQGKLFLDSLVEYMSSGPVVAILLQKSNAVADLRILVGATDPAKAAVGTIRQEIGLDVQQNSVHASDSLETATGEISFFF